MFIIVSNPDKSKQKEEDIYPLHLELACLYLKIPFLKVESFNNLKEKLKNANGIYHLIIKENTIVNKNIVSILGKILLQKKDIVLGYNEYKKYNSDIKIIKKNDRIVKNYDNNIIPNAVLIENSNLLKNNDFREVFSDKYEYIINKSLFVPTKIHQNLVISPVGDEDLLFNNLRNKAVLKEVVKSIKGELSAAMLTRMKHIIKNKENNYLDNEIIKTRNKYGLRSFIIVAQSFSFLHKVYIQLKNKGLLTPQNSYYIFIKDERSELITKYIQTHFKSRFTLFNYSEKNLKLVLNDICHFESVFFILAEKDLHNLNSLEDESYHKNVIISNNKLLMTKKVYLDYILFENYIEKGLEEALIYVSNILSKLEKDILFLGTNKLKDNRYFFNFHLFEKLYDLKDFDAILTLISNSNNVTDVTQFIPKLLAILPYINYVMEQKDLDMFIKKLEIDNTVILRDISTILIATKNSIFVPRLIKEYASKNKLRKKNYIDILDSLNKIPEINNLKLDEDFVEFLVKHLEKLTKVVKINKLYKDLIDNIFGIIFSLENEFSEIYEANGLDTKKIIELYEDASNLNLKQIGLGNFNKELFIKYFSEKPFLVLYHVEKMSDFMKNEKSIKKQREYSLLCYSTLATYFEDKFDELKMIFKDKEIYEKFLIRVLSSFTYSYHGESSRELFIVKKKFAGYLIKIIFEDENDILFDYDINPIKNKILFISEFLNRKHSVFKDRHQVISKLSEKYNVSILLTDKLFNEIGDVFKNTNILKSKKSLSQLPELVRKLRNERYDKVVFCEIGMSSIFHLLAFFRIGKKQYNTWGHSDTSGLPNIDYFVSSKYYELPLNDAQKNYSEKLILQNGLCTSYVNPTSSYTLTKKTYYYGLSNKEKILLCPQSLFKIYPNYDNYIKTIMERNPDTTLVFLDALKKKERLLARWENKMGRDIFKRVKFVNRCHHKEFVNLIKISTVMLDPFPFGGCNTSMEAFSLGIPIVTQPSNLINGRFTYGFYQKMGINDCIAYNEGEYIEITTKLLQDEQFNKEVRKKIINNNDVLFLDQETIKEWEQMLID